MFSLNLLEKYARQILSSRGLFLLLFCKLIFIVFLQIRYSSDYAHTSMIDNDGAAAVKTLDKTGLLKNNKFYAYGPLYYRAAHIVNGLGWAKGSLREEYLYFSLIFVSLLAAVLSFYFIFKFVNPLKIWLNANLALLTFFYLLAVTDDTFHLYFLLPHPDYFQAFLLVLVIYWGANFIENRNPLNFLGAFIFLGFALSTKLSSLYFIPALVFGFLFTSLRIRSKAHWKLMAWGLFCMVLAYFLSGIPQNFKIGKTLDFLIRQRELFQASPTLESIQHWFYLLGRNLLPFLPLALVLPRGSRSKKTLKLSFLYLVIAFLLMAFSLRTVIGADYYIFLFVFTGFFVFMLFPVRGSSILTIAFAIVLIFWPVPDFYLKAVEHKESCRAPVRAAISEMKTRSPNYDVTIQDALTPEEMQHSFKRSWGLRLESFKNNKTLFMINWSFGNQFNRPQDDYHKVTNPHWEEHRTLYSQFKNHSSFEMQNILFNRVATPGCNLELWEAIHLP